MYEIIRETSQHNRHRKYQRKEGGAIKRMDRTPKAQNGKTGGRKEGNGEKGGRRRDGMQGSRRKLKRKKETHAAGKVRRNIYRKSKRIK